MPNSKKNFAGKDLRNVNLSGDSMRSADFSHTRLGGAFLRGVDFTDADLSHADLHGAHLEGANLGGTDLHNADFTDADVRGARIENAAVLDGVQLTNATGVPAGVCGAEPASPPVSDDGGVGPSESHAPVSATPSHR